MGEKGTVSADKTLYKGYYLFDLPIRKKFSTILGTAGKGCKLRGTLTKAS